MIQLCSVPVAERFRVASQGQGVGTSWPCAHDVNHIRCRSSIKDRTPGTAPGLNALRDHAMKGKVLVVRDLIARHSYAMLVIAEPGTPMPKLNAKFTCRTVEVPIS